MKIFVINLKKDVHRHDAMLKQLNSHGLTHEFVSAVDGCRLTEDEVALHCDFKWMRRHEGQIMSRGMIGCALSHLKIYKEIIDKNIDMALILEDDVVIGSDTAKVISSLEEQLLAKQPVLVLFSKAKKSGRKAVRVCDGYKMLALKQGWFAHAYVITQTGASRLLKELYPISHMLDCWTWLARHHVVDIFTVSPELCRQAREQFGSLTTLNSFRMPKMFTRAWLHYRVYRTAWKVLDWVCPLRWRKETHVVGKFDL